MGDRISISFVNGHEESVALFSHWMGIQLLDATKKYFNWLKAKVNKTPLASMPLDRLKPETVMVDFIRWLTKDMDIVQHDLYLGKNEKDGDNSDNGHYKIDLKTGDCC